MGFAELLMKVLSIEIETPQAYGWFHLSFWGLTVLATAILLEKRKAFTGKRLTALLMSVWGVLVLFEICKVTLYSLQIGEETTWRYAWHTFPFQFCDLPFYLLPAIAFIKKDAVRDVLEMFFACYVFFAGLVVYFYPLNVFCASLILDVGTMVHHGAQIALGMLFAARLIGKQRLSYRTFGAAVGIFVGVTAIAIVLNGLAPLFTEGDFNMFYIGRRTPCKVGIVEWGVTTLPYGVFLLLYFIAMSLPSFGIFSLYRLAARKLREPQAPGAEESAEAAESAGSEKTAGSDGGTEE